MNDLEFDSKGDDQRSRGVLQKFNMLFQTGLNDELQTLLFKKVHRYTYDSTVKALESVAPDTTSFQKGPELIGRVSSWLRENGFLSPVDPVDREDWWIVTAPVRVKAGSAWHPGWIYSTDMLTGVVFYRRNPVSGTWNYIYCPLFNTTQGDGPEMPTPIQSMAVKLILAKFPSPKVPAGEVSGKSLKLYRQIAEKWKKQVDLFILEMPWDKAKVQRELVRYYREKALEHPFEPRGWDDWRDTEGD